MVSNAARKNDRWSSNGMSVGLAADRVGTPKKKKREKKEKKKTRMFCLVR